MLIIQFNSLINLIKMQVIKSPNDRRSFKHIKLSNDLEVLLISDQLTQKSAASLSVNIGSKNDDDVEGIAHFLEHMLFMGSTKYPNENQYDVTVKENNGMSNAFTADDHTNFYFSCVPEGLFTVLDIFAQFFISPLLKEEAVSRELQAVDSEYQNSLTNDSWRFDAAKKQFMRSSHPNSKFNIGCVETLDIPNIRDKVMSFYNNYYSSHLMKLVVVGKEQLDELEKNVIEMFTLVPKKNVSLNTNYGNQFDAPIYGYVMPMKDEEKLDMSWEFELDDDFDVYHIDNFISHIMGHEGKGSLFDLLYQQFLVKSLCAGVEHVDDIKKMLTIEINLTEIGFQKVDLIKQTVEEYIKMFSESAYVDILKLYNEHKMTREIAFENYEVPDAESFVTSLTSFWVTRDIKPEYLISYDYTFDEYSVFAHNALTDVLSKMTFGNSIIFERSKSFNQLSSELFEIKEEKWYKVKYCESIPPLILNGADLVLRLPYENAYMHNNTKILSDTNNNESPVLIPLTNIDLWWKYDTTYNIPDVTLIFNMILPNKSKTLKDRVISKLYFRCLDHIINADLYNINCANYRATIQKNSNGFGVYVSGYPEKFVEVLNFIVQSLLNFKNNLTIDLYHNIVKIYEQELENYIYTPPFRMISHELSTNIANDIYIIKDTIAMLNTITYDDLINFDLFDTSDTSKIISNYKKRLVDTLPNNFLYGLIQGNINRDDATKIASYLSKLNATYNLHKLTEQIKDDVDCEFTKHLENDDEANSCYKLAIKIGYLRPDLDKHYIEKLSCLQILNEIISEQYYDQLRTKEQLGYVVQSYVYNYGNDTEQSYTTYDFCVQSPNKNAEFLRNRTMKFIIEFRDFLLNKSDESISNLISSQILQLQKPFQNLKKASSYNFSVIAGYCANFNIKNDKMQYMQTVTKETLINFYDTYFSLKDNTYWSMMLESSKKIDIANVN